MFENVLKFQNGNFFFNKHMNKKLFFLISRKKNQENISKKKNKNTKCLKVSEKKIKI